MSELKTESDSDSCLEGKNGLSACLHVLREEHHELRVLIRECQVSSCVWHVVGDVESVWDPSTNTVDLPCHLIMEPIEVEPQNTCKSKVCTEVECSLCGAC